MAYTPTTWAAGDKVTAEKLNNIEQGIVGAENVTVILHATSTTPPEGAVSALILDKTLGEIQDSLESGATIYGYYEDADAGTFSYEPLIAFVYDENPDTNELEYTVAFTSLGYFSGAALTDYPIYAMS